ncbi:MAG: glycerophosphodiester phosphodiesterase [Thermoleophilaceae bacterium]
MKRRLGLAIACVALALPASASAIEIHAHRGGTLENGVAVTPENSMTAFQHAAGDLGADVIELDAKVTSDGVPVVMHDPTLDRTTDCAGQVRDRTAAQVLACRIDILGTDDTTVPFPASAEFVPSLAAVLEWARDEGVRLNLEIKNPPTDPDFDPTPAFATAVLDAVDASGIPKQLVLIQSFWPVDLVYAKLRGYTTSLLTQSALNELGLVYATAAGHEWVSPQWPPLDGPLYVQLAHLTGRKVVTWTLDTEQPIRDAEAAGVDGIITNDVVLAQQVLSTP